MSIIHSGVLLPATFLTTTAFTAFALFVAVNTLIYLGLTVAKALPWPAQIHPQRVRSLVPGRRGKDDDTMHTAAPRQPADPFMAPRERVAASNIPLALALMGGVVVLLTILNAILDSVTGLLPRLVSLGIGLAMLLMAMVLPKVRASGRVMSWTWAILSLVLVCKLAWDAVRLDSAIGLTYSALALVLLSPISMSWAASLVGSGLGVVVTATAGIIVDAVSSPPWVVGALAAFLSGLILLQLRLNVVDALTEERMRTQTLSTTDPLTGMLSRPGLLSLAPSLWSAARETRRTVQVAVCTIDEMARINADYGLQYGDDVIAAVGRAVHSCMPADAIVARWDGATFLAVELGDALAPRALADDIRAALEASGIALGKRAIRVRIGIASGDPADSSIDDLALEAHGHRSAGA